MGPVPVVRVVDVIFGGRGSKHRGRERERERESARSYHGRGKENRENRQPAHGPAASRVPEKTGEKAKRKRSRSPPPKRPVQNHPQSERWRGRNTCCGDGDGEWREAERHDGGRGG